MFRPRLPIDPFADPWQEYNSFVQPLTILILGNPNYADLAPLCLSTQLTSSLLVIATHTPPPVPEHSQCTVIILRLPAPLDIHDSGAVRLASLLDRAQRVAHAWHSAPNAYPRIQQLAELYPGGDFSITEQPELALPTSTPAPLLTPLSGADSETSSLSSIASSRASKYSPVKGQPKSTFSALINFLPASLSDKALLKHAILVTTLSAPFLAPQQTPSPYPATGTKRQSFFSSLSLASTDSSRRRSRIASLFSSPPSSYSSPPSLRGPPSLESLKSTNLMQLRKRRYAHIVHVLPYSSTSPAHGHRSLVTASTSNPGPSSLNPNRRPYLTSHAQAHSQSHVKNKLVQSIEQFLLSYAYPPSASVSAPSLGAGISPPVPPVPSSSSLSSHTTTTTTHRAPARSSLLASSSGGNPRSTSVFGAKAATATATGTGTTSATRRTSAMSSGSLQVPGSPNPNASTNPNTPLAPAPAPRAIPFLLPSGALGAFPDPSPTTDPSTRSRSRCMCIGEMVLFGGLDAAAAGLAVGVGVVGTGPSPSISGGRSLLTPNSNARPALTGTAVTEGVVGEVVGEAGWPRAWIGGRADVLVQVQVQDDASTSTSTSPCESGPPSPVGLGLGFGVDVDVDAGLGTSASVTTNGKGKARAKAKENTQLEAQIPSLSKPHSRPRPCSHLHPNETGLPTPPESESAGSSSASSSRSSAEGDSDSDAHVGEVEGIERSPKAYLDGNNTRPHQQRVVSHGHANALGPGNGDRRYSKSEPHYPVSSSSISAPASAPAKTQFKLKSGMSSTLASVEERDRDHDREGKGVKSRVLRLFGFGGGGGGSVKTKGVRVRV